MSCYLREYYQVLVKTLSTPSLALVMHVFNHCTHEAGVGGSLGLRPAL